MICAVGKNCIHKTVSQPTNEEIGNLEMLIFQAIHYNLRKKNLLFRSLKYTMKVKDRLIILKNPFFCSTLCREPICIFAQYCFHTKPSVKPYWERMKVFVQTTVDKFCEPFVMNHSL